VDRGAETITSNNSAKGSDSHAFVKTDCLSPPRNDILAVYKIELGFLYS